MTINALLYGGFLLIISGVILFVVSIIKLREIEREEFRNQQLHKAFMKARKIKKWNIKQMVILAYIMLGLWVI